MTPSQTIAELKDLKRLVRRQLFHDALDLAIAALSPPPPEPPQMKNEISRATSQPQLRAGESDPRDDDRGGAVLFPTPCGVRHSSGDRCKLNHGHFGHHQTYGNETWPVATVYRDQL